MKNLINHLLGDTRSAILAVLLLRPNEPKHVRELARLTGVSPGTLHRELTALASFGVINRKEVGRQVFFAANPECPVLEDIAGLLRKTVGSVDVIRDALTPYIAGINVVFVYVSIAAGNETLTSDVDVMILGNLSLGEAVQALTPAEEVLRRQINPTVMKLVQFHRKRGLKDGFVAQVLKSPKVWVIGSADDLR